MDCHAGESRYKSFKAHDKTASSRDNELHIIRRENEAMAAQAMADGQSWSAWAYDRTERKMKRKTIEASEACIEFVKAVSEEGSKGRERGTGRPRGAQEWSVDLRSASPAAGGSGGWQDAIVGMLAGLGSRGLLDLYKRWYSCGRVTGDTARCGNDSCPRCWNSRGEGLVRKSVDYKNFWAGAPPRVSAGTGLIRGAAMVDAAEKRDGFLWLLGPLGVDVELYYTREALDAQEAGPAGTCTLGRVAFFFDHVGNPIHGGEGQGVKTKWVAVSEYVTAGRGSSEQLDPATGHPVMRIQKKLSFFPAEAIRQVVHLYHRCPENKCAPRPESGTGLVWQHVFDPEGSNYFLYNRHFRGPSQA